MIAVAATQQNGAHADFSTVRTYNAVAAPGVGITSAKNTGGTWLVNGTSPACAPAAGVVALMRSHNDRLTPAQIRTILITTAHRPPPGGRARRPGRLRADQRRRGRQGRGLPAPRQGGGAGFKGTKHLAAPDGTPKATHPEMEQILWLGGLGAAGAGLLMVIGCVLLARKGHRRTAA